MFASRVQKQFSLNRDLDRPPILLYVHRSEVAYQEREEGGAWGGRGRKSDGSTADTARKRPERPWTAATENNGSVKVVSPRPHCAATSALRNCCFNCHVGQSHKDNVCCTAVEEQPEAKEVQLSQPSSNSLLMISSGLTWGSTSLFLIGR